MLVVWTQAPEVGTAERIAVDAIAGGWATTDHYNVLADCRDLLAIAVGRKHDASAAAVAELSLIALLNIKDRHAETGKIGATGDELQALRLLVDTSEEFWLRQSGELFRVANGVLDQERRAVA